MTREYIITSMCYTFRHDYGAPESAFGMSASEKTQLWKDMAQIFDNDIWPMMDFRVNKQ